MLTSAEDDRVHLEGELHRQISMKRLAHDEARRMAVNFAKLQELPARSSSPESHQKPSSCEPRAKSWIASRKAPTARQREKTVFAEIIKYLRDLAQTCTRLARVCPHSLTAHGLQEIAIDLMARAKELEQLELD